MPDQKDSLGGETVGGDAKADPAEQSLGDGATIGGDIAACRHSLKPFAQIDKPDRDCNKITDDDDDELKKTLPNPR